jgi:hypothetical protein
MTDKEWMDKARELLGRASWDMPLQSVVIESHLREQPSPWISVSDSLPDESVYVLVYSASDKRQYVVARYDLVAGDEPYYSWSGCDVSLESGEVTHWMPLMVPPKESA